MRVSSAISRRPPSYSRSEWILMLGSSLTVIAIVSIVTFLLIRERSSAEQSATRAASNIVQLIDADVLRNVELYDLSLQGLISTSQRTDLSLTSPQIRHLLMFDQAIAAPHKGDILLLDPHGDVLADSASIKPRSDNFADREYFQSHVQNPDSSMFVSRPFRARTPEQDWRISFSRRVSSPQGEFLGVAEAAMRLNYFNQLFRSLSIERDSSVNLISTDGVLLAQEPPLAENLIGKDFSNRPNFIRMMREGNGSFSAVSSRDNKHRLYTFSRVGELPFIVIVALSADEVFAPWRRTAVLISVATGVLCIGLLWLTWLLCHELRRRHRAEQELAQLAATDGLTGLVNRRSLDQTLKLEWARAQRSGQALSLLMIDVDHFKAFNDKHGHQLGDDALSAVANVIKSNIRRPGDLAARYGGEEFTVVLPKTDSGGAVRIAENIRAAVERMAPVKTGDSPITVSIGISTWTGQPGARLESVLLAADQALYQAKGNGRNRVVAG